MGYKRKGGNLSKQYRRKHEDNGSCLKGRRRPNLLFLFAFFKGVLFFISVCLPFDNKI